MTYPVTAGKYHLRFIAYLQALAIVLVVVYHSFHEYPGGDFGYGLWGMRLLATMRMPVFLFISGYLMVLTTRRKNPAWTSYAAGKVKRLLIPFLVLSLLTFVPRAMLSSMADDPVELSFSSLAASLTRSESMVIPFFWYLQASIILLCGTYLLTILARRVGIPPVALYIFLLLFFVVVRGLDFVHTDLFSISRIMQWGANFFLGALYAMLPERIDSRIPWTKPLFTLTAAAVWVILFIFLEGNLWLSQLVTIAAYVTFISLTKILEQRHIGILDHLVGANYIIFLLSWYFNIAAQQVLHHFVPATPWWVCTILSIIFGVYVPLALYRILRSRQRNILCRIVSFLLGQKF